MNFDFGYRASESPLVETIWQTCSQTAGQFISRAEFQWEMVITRYQGQTYLTLRGPETQASLADCPAEAEFFGIVFKLGVFMPHLALTHLINRQDITLPSACHRSVWLYRSTWEVPTFENADSFIQRLSRAGILQRDPLIESARQGHVIPDLSLRSLQRRFIRATGLSQQTIVQIDRAHQAAALLQGGQSILDTVFQLGYSDQPHLTKALRRFIGQTPAQLACRFYTSAL
jgi:AraC-like DNA-binding protein